MQEFLNWVVRTDVGSETERFWEKSIAPNSQEDSQGSVPARTLRRFAREIAFMLPSCGQSGGGPLLHGVPTVTMSIGLCLEVSLCPWSLCAHRTPPVDERTITLAPLTILAGNAKVDC